MKRILVVRTVVRIVIDAAQNQTFRQGAEEQVLVRVRSGARGNGVHLAVDGPHRILGRALLKGLDVRHLYGRIQCGLLCEQGSIDDVDLVIGVRPAGHKRQCVLASLQSYLDIDAFDKEFILQEQVHVETVHHVNDTTLHGVHSSSQVPCISRGSVDDMNGIHVSVRVLVPHLTRQLHDFGIVAVT